MISSFITFTVVLQPLLLSEKIRRRQFDDIFFHFSPRKHGLTCQTLFSEKKNK